MDKKALEEENYLLRQENLATKAQSSLFESLLKMVGSASETHMLGHTMKETLDITARLSNAQTGSLFLLDETGMVTESLLTRGTVAPDLRTRIVGTVLDRGLAGWVRTHLQVGLVKDTHGDDRWVSLPDEPYQVRSVLAVPIIKHDALFGIVTLMHPEPNHFSLESVGVVQMTADHMALAIEGAQAHARIEELNRLRQKALERDLELARQVQESFLPARVPEIDGYAFAAVNRPALAVGGDFYYFYALPNNKLGMALGDVSGKGIAASLFMARVSSDLQHYAPLFLDPSRLMSKMNRILCRRSKQGMFITLVYLVVDLVNGEVYFANAGHIPPIYMDTKGVHQMEEDQAKGPPLGIIPEATYGCGHFFLRKKGMVLLYTDGVLEAKDESRKIFGFDRLNQILDSNLDPEMLVDKIVATVDGFSIGQGDDLTLACIKRE